MLRQARRPYEEATRAVRAAVVAGRLPPLSQCRCMDCGIEATIYHHHKGYKPAHREAVVPLCHWCHVGRHRKALPTPLRKRYYTGSMEPPRIVSTNIRFPEDVYAQLTDLAKEQRRSINQAVVVAVERYIRQTRTRQPKQGDER